MDLTFRIHEIIRGTTVDGPGFRTSIYFSGCEHHCPGCHNPQTWDRDKGELFTLSQILEIIREENFDVTLSGGDPLVNPYKTAFLISEIKKLNKNVWLYTGFSWEEINKDIVLFKAIENADVIVDGKFILEKKTEELPFRGSSNQRLIDVKRSLLKNDIVLWERN